MQNINNGMGVTQFNGMKPKSSISVGGVEWALRRDATDSTTAFPHPKGQLAKCWLRTYGRWSGSLLLDNGCDTTNARYYRTSSECDVCWLPPV